MGGGTFKAPTVLRFGEYSLFRKPVERKAGEEHLDLPGPPSHPRPPRHDQVG